MQEKILVFDSSIGYAKYFEKIYKKSYEVTSAFYFSDLKKVDIFHFDTIIFMVNEIEDLKLFSRIHSSYKGIRLFLGVTKQNIITETAAMYFNDTFSKKKGNILAKISSIMCFPQPHKKIWFLIKLY